jgi:hypothetical protein
MIGGVLFLAMLAFMLNRVTLKSPAFFALLWLIYGVLCLSTNGRLLLIRPWQIECLAFWIPLLCLHFSAGSKSSGARVSLSDVSSPG